MKFILGLKQNMAQYLDKDGKAYPATLLSTGPVVATQVKTKEKDKYNAIQFGYGKKKNVKKPQGKLAELSPDKVGFKYLKELRLNKENSDIKIGDIIDVSIFKEGDKVEVSGISKGKGFQGVVKRHGFHGGPRTHGQKHSEREPGSIGAGGVQRVFKGKRMAGRMGSDRVTVKNLKVLKIDKDNNEMLVSGAIPGRRGTLLEIKG
ncbi:MAG: 50S ribosomal protein L3 [Parcubacteria group bacterium CG10_big_fil_rev_8_21_14_0_10_38_31]|nr:MAG: 50S ribosomal protein L3 [Parcubacteria group bacterium CG10_big_fil_rev_8_21_14_0_10_38_31]